MQGTGMDTCTSSAQILSWLPSTVGQTDASSGVDTVQTSGASGSWASLSPSFAIEGWGGNRRPTRQDG